MTDDIEVEIYTAGGTGSPSPEVLAEWSGDDLARVLLAALRLAALDATRGDETAAAWVAEVGPPLVRRWLQPSAAAQLERFSELTPSERRELLPELGKMVTPNRTRRRRVPAAASWPPPDPQGWRG